MRLLGSFQYYDLIGPLFPLSFLQNKSNCLFQNSLLHLNQTLFLDLCNSIFRICIVSLITSLMVFTPLKLFSFLVFYPYDFDANIITNCFFLGYNMLSYIKFEACVGRIWNSQACFFFFPNDKKRKTYPTHMQVGHHLIGLVSPLKKIVNSKPIYAEISLVPSY